MKCPVCGSSRVTMGKAGKKCQKCGFITKKTITKEDMVFV